MRILLTFLIIFCLIISPLSADNISLERILPDNVDAGGEIEVILILNLSGNEKPTGIIIKEYIPEGWRTKNQTPMGYSFSKDEKVTWLLYGDMIMEGRLKYVLQIPENATGDYIIKGEVVTLAETYEISGDSQVTVISSLNPVWYLIFGIFIILILAFGTKYGLKRIKEDSHGKNRNQ